MVLSIISPILYYSIKYCTKCTFAILAIIYLLNINLYLIANVSLLFYAIGALYAINSLRSYELSINKWYYLTSVWIILLILNTLLILHYKNSFTVFLSNLNNIMGIIVFWTMYDNYIKYVNKKMLLMLAQYTFIIYVTHEPILWLLKEVSIKIIFAKLHIINGYSLLFIYFITPIVAIAFSTLSAYLLKKYCQNLNQIITGGRSSLTWSK